MPDENEKTLVEQAADALNDLVEDATLTAADAAIDPAPIAPAPNGSVHIPEATEVAVPAGVTGGGGDREKK